MFQLSENEWKSMTMSSQIVMTSKRPKNALPYAFTEQGIAMLSGILNSDIAINVNIAIMRTFVLSRKHLLQDNGFHKKLEALEAKYDKQFGDVYEVLRFLVQKDTDEKGMKKRRQIGFNK